MKPYSSIFFSQGQYRHLTADSPQEARQLLIDFTIDRLVEPIGVYNSLTDRFTYCLPKADQLQTALNEQRRSAASELWSHIDRLRKREPAPVTHQHDPSELALTT